MTRAAATHAGWTARLAQAGVPPVEALLDAPPHALRGAETLHKPGLRGRERWRWKLAADPDGATVYVKRYRATPWRDQLDRILRQQARHSRAWWEFRQSELLHDAHVSVTRAVAFAEEMRGALERRSIVLFESAPGDAFDRAWSAALRRDEPVTRGRARFDIARRLGRFVAAFHQTGICHRDLYLCHVFVVLDAAAQCPPQFCLIDLARTHRPRFWRLRWVLKDLSQLDASARQIGATRADRLRGLLAYLGLEPGAPRARDWSRRVVARSDRIIRRVARRAAASRA
ncbi:MAG: lipopolysaccharide kinase InaA family protein [Phycisphaerae bacterium]